MPKIVNDETVYRAAMQAVIDRGYAGATTKQIAEAAGISEVTLFRKYGNKAELVRQAIVNRAAQIDFDSATVYTGDVEADLLRVVETYQGTAERDGRFFYTIMSEIGRTSDLNDVLDTPVGMMGQVAMLLALYQHEGILNPEPPLQAVAGLLGPLMVTNMIRANVQNVDLPPMDLSQHVSHFLNGRKVRAVGDG